MLCQLKARSLKDAFISFVRHTHQVCNLCQIYHCIDIIVTLNKGQTPFLPYR